MPTDFVPFNDLTRIHQPLLPKFLGTLSDQINNSEFILGERVSKFEQLFAQFENANFAVGVNSGTSALILALKSIGIKPGDEVITSNLTFVATVFAILEVGAIPVIIDTCDDNPNICTKKLENAISKRTKAVIFVSLHGSIFGLNDISQFCRMNQISLVLDAAQSHGAKINGESQSSFVDLACFSFYPGKNLGALGDGGAVVTESRYLTDLLKMQRDWGSVKKYHHENWGGNFRLDSIQAAFLSLKMEFLEDWTKERRQIALQYAEKFPDKFQVYTNATPESHVYHVYAISVDRRSAFIDSLSLRGIQTGIHYPKTISEQKFYAPLVKVVGAQTSSLHYAQTLVSLPIFPKMTEDEIAYVTENVLDILTSTA